MHQRPYFACGNDEMRALSRSDYGHASGFVAQQSRKDAPLASARKSAALNSALPAGRMASSAVTSPAVMLCALALDEYY